MLLVTSNVPFQQDLDRMERRNGSFGSMEDLGRLDLKKKPFPFSVANGLCAVFLLLSSPVLLRSTPLGVYVLCTTANQPRSKQERVKTPVIISR